MNRINDFVSGRLGDLIESIKKIALISSPPFGEKVKIEFLRQLVEKMGFKDYSIDAEGNLVVVEWGERLETVIFSAHTDTVFSEDTKLKIVKKGSRLYCPGICDNATGVGALLLLMEYVKSGLIKPRYTTVFLFNVGEEELGNLRGVRCFFNHIDRALVKAHICIEGAPLGRIMTKAVGSHRKRITIRGPGGHSWIDYGRANCIVLAARLISELDGIALPREPKTTLNIGTINGGTSINSIPSEASFTLEVRGPKEEIISAVISKANDIVSRYVSPGITVMREALGNRPAGEMKDESLVSLVRGVQEELQIKTLGGEGSTDSNYPISLGLPSLTIGIASGGDTHSINEYLKIEEVEMGVRQLIYVFERLNSAGI